MNQVSVIIPTYNRAWSLKRALESVHRQTFQDFDLWVVDDGSTDDTFAVWSEWRESLTGSWGESRCHYIKTENRGVSAARNLAIEKSAAPWVALLDSDDEWLPEKLELQMGYVVKHPEIDLVHGEEIWIRKGKRVNPKKKHRKSGGWIFQRCLELCLISPSCVLLRRELLNRVGLFNEAFTVCEDYDLWLRITHKHEVGYLEEPLIQKYGGHEDQLSQKYFAMDHWRVKSMAELLKSNQLKSEDAQRCLEVLREKAEILKEGYKKHGHQDKYKEMLQYLSWVPGTF